MFEVQEFINRSEEYSKNHVPPPIFPDVLADSERIRTIIYVIVFRNAGCGLPRLIPDFLIVDDVYKFKEVLIISHTDCGVTYVDDNNLRSNLKKANPGHDEIIDSLHIGGFKNNFDRVKEDVEYFRSHPLVRKELVEHTFGVVCDIFSGKITQVDIPWCTKEKVPEPRYNSSRSVL
ncbi:hypothetical protein M426DRAFT_16149 [Hypoxylon sp. CI-4A]|nr:hypothetical protein M426DRAFT_16149 [Hypoxylon sp. CI-4A]